MAEAHPGSRRHLSIREPERSERRADLGGRVGEPNLGREGLPRLASEPDRTHSRAERALDVDRVRVADVHDAVWRCAELR
jgi:hypothetical protein